MAETLEEMLEHGIEDVEGIFTPKPGGMVDRHRAERARREAAQREQENADERVEERAFRAVKTTLLAPEVMIAQTVTIPAGGNAPILPLSPYRFRATLSLASAAVNNVLANPGVGNPFTYVLPYAASILAVNATYHNSTAGTEFPNIQIQDPNGNIVAEIPWGTINATSAVPIFAAVGSFAQQSGGTNTAFMPLPTLGTLPAGYKVVIGLVNGGDSVTGIDVMLSPGIIIARDSGAAIAGNGYLLTAGTPLIMQNRANMFAFNPTGQPVNISVAAEIYSPEN